MGCGLSLVFSALFPLSYVGLLHLFDKDGTDRNEPSSVRKRICAATLNSVLAVGVTYLVLKQDVDDPLSHMGFRISGSLAAVVLPALLTSVLYAGQWLMLYYDGHLQYLFDIAEWRRSFSQITWIRDSIVAPVTEEIAFRACSVSLLSLCFSPGWTVLIAPLSFALSHFHHIGDDRRKGFTLNESILRRSFQFLYTYAFGAFATYLFLSSRHVLCPIVAHSICNSFGLPMFHEIGNYTGKGQRVALWTTYLLGIGAFAVLVGPLTSPAMYSVI